MTVCRVLGGVVLALAIGVAPVAAQLAGPTRNDQFIGLFLQNAGGESGWVGGVTAKGDADLDSAQHFNVSWQLDYGSSGKTLVTASTGARPQDVSKNSGDYTLGYTRRYGPTWLVAADGGVEHRRAATDTGELDDSASFVVNASLRNIGARKLGSQRAPELSWLLQANITTTGALAPDGTDTRAVFFDPVGVVWLAFLSREIPAATPEADPVLVYRFLLRSEVAVMRAFDRGLDDEGHWESSLTFFFTPANGIMLRRFGGFFDHNLRDRKQATTLNIIWKFR